MDPNACLALFIDAASNGDVESMEEHYENLVEWIKKGGFPPTALSDSLRV